MKNININEIIESTKDYVKNGIEEYLSGREWKTYIKVAHITFYLL